MIIFEDYIMKRRASHFIDQEPLFPFDYGLSYTTFRHGTPELGTTLECYITFVSLRFAAFSLGIRRVFAGSSPIIRCCFCILPLMYLHILSVYLGSGYKATIRQL
jgi:hypothetical protein